MTDEAEVIARQMAAFAKSPDQQIAQTRFRLQLARGWAIPEGSKVLEIGCGQGDMTAVLAHLVGRDGRVTAVDAAGSSYGAPVSLGESAERLSRTALGKRVEFRFDFDLFEDADAFRPDEFDIVVFAHCSWYFKSLDQFRRALLRVRLWASRLCYSEWDLEPRTIDQVAHLLAVLFQGQVEAYRSASDANVRSPFSKSRLKALLGETGWIIGAEALIETEGLDDAAWEIANCLGPCLEAARGLDLPPRLCALLESQRDVLRSFVERQESRSLSSYSIVASRLAGEYRR